MGQDACTLLEAVQQWLSAEESLRDPRTSQTYAIYAGAHWQPHFDTVSGITSESCEAYRAQRLLKVSASSVSKELGALRAFVRWLGLDVEVPTIPRRTTGNRRATAWRGAQEVSPDEAEAILARLPHDARQRYTFGYDTSLRGETIDCLEVPAHWHTRSAYVQIPRELDKARAGRPMPLTPRALAILESRLACMWSAPCSPAAGPLFGPNRWRKTLKAAGVAVLGEVRGRRLVPTDLRAGRITHWLEESANMPGVQALAGHSRATTTARYVKPSLRAAEAVLGVSGPGFRGPPTKS